MMKVPRRVVMIQTQHLTTTESGQHVADQKASDTASDNNDDGTADEDRKDVADAKATGTVVSGDNDIDPTPDDNGKDDEHVADQKATEEVSCSIELNGLDVDPKESAEEDVRGLHLPGTRSGFYTLNINGANH
jgi:hypothetical protein